MAATLPPIDDLKDALKIATLAESGEHLYGKLQERVKAVRPFVSAEEYDKLGMLLDKVDVFSKSLGHDKASLQYMEKVVWSGKPLPGPEELAGIKAEARLDEQEYAATPVLPEKNQKVSMRMQFNENEALSRGYLVDGKEINKNTQDIAERMDSSFHTWLKQQPMTCKSQHIFHVSEDGEILRDENDEPVAVDLDEFKKQILSDETGLKPYVNAHARGFTLEALRVDLPSKKLAQKIASDAQETEKLSVEAEPKVTSESGASQSKGPDEPVVMPE